jgi:hypothetical protein
MNVVGSANTTACCAMRTSATSARMKRFAFLKEALHRSATSETTSPPVLWRLPS